MIYMGKNLKIAILIFINFFYKKKLMKINKVFKLPLLIDVKKK